MALARWNRAFCWLACAGMVKTQIPWASGMIALAGKPAWGSMSIPIPLDIASASAATFDCLASLFAAVDGETAWLADHVISAQRALSLRQLEKATGRKVEGKASGLAAVAALPMEERISLFSAYYWAAAGFDTARQDPEFVSKRQIGEIFGEPWPKLTKSLSACVLPMPCRRCTGLGTASITPMEHSVQFTCPACGQTLDTRWRSALPLDEIPQSASVAGVANSAQKLILDLLIGLNEVIDLAVTRLSGLDELLDEAPPPDPLHLPPLSRVERAVLEGVRLGNRDALSLAEKALSKLGGHKKRTNAERVVDRLVTLGMLRRRSRLLPAAALFDSVATQMFYIRGAFATTKGWSTGAFLNIRQIQQLAGSIFNAPASKCVLRNRPDTLSFRAEMGSSPLKADYIDPRYGEIISADIDVTRNRLTGLWAYSDPEYEIIEEGVPVEGNRLLERLFRSDAEASLHIALNQRFPNAIIQANPRLIDVVGRDAFRRITGNFREEDSRYLAHCYVDWAIYDADGYPACVIELQRGPHHDDPEWLRKDRLKRKLCLSAGLRFEEKF